MPASHFNYEQAFTRNLGLVSPQEQERLRRTCVALPGLGGVGGAHLQALARMGIGSFRLADPDTFEVANFNRQLGASMATVGRSKAEVMAETVREINPEAAVTTFCNGIGTGNMNEFLDGVDVVVDGIDFYRIDVRRKLYRACRERRIPVVNAGPIGYGAAVIVFTPEGPSFDEYFGLVEGMTRAEMLLSFALGLGPGIRGDVDPKYIDLENERGPALASACLLCAGAAATEVVKLVTGRGTPALAGRGIYFDLMRNRVLRLKATPPLKSSLRGRVLRWAAFRRIPAFRRMHEDERARLGAEQGVVTTASA